jgi:ribose transport system substrate-binding protein
VNYRTAILAYTLLVGLTFGCGKEESAPPIVPGNPPGGNGATSASSTGGPITTTDLDKVVVAAMRYKITLVVKTRNNPFFDPMIKAFEAEGKVINVKTDVQAPPQEGDTEKQFSIVDNIVAKGADAILVTPADSKGIIPALKKAQEKGILVVNLDNRVDKSIADSAGLKLGGYVGADNEQGGKLAGEEMVKALGGKGKVAIMEGIRGVDNAEARKRGFESGVAGKLEIIARETGEWETEKAYAKFQSILAAHRDINGVFCANDNMALGVLKAISESGMKGKIKVIGYDNIKDVQPHLNSGAMLATVEQHPDFMGKYGLKMAVGILNGIVPKGKEYLVSLDVIKKK